MSLVRKVIYSCKFGGVKYLIYKVLDRMNGSANAGELRYKIISGADERQYPQLLEKLYAASTGEKLHLEAPVTYNEKIQWIKLYDKNPLSTMLSDKYKVCDWVADKIGEEYLIPLFGVWDRFDDIDFSKLPRQFVLKLNTGSGANVIVKDKAEFDLSSAREKITNAMNKNFAYYWMELHYKDIVPKIIAEKYLCQNNNELYDYKFMCFNGEVKYFWVDTGRFTHHRRYIFDAQGNFTQYRWGYSNAGNVPKLPSNYKEMIRLAAKLSEGFRHVRVDLYNVEGKIYFGEMTFTTEGGLNFIAPKEFNVELGSYINLPTDKTV
ncbi:MAG: glycosyltransferase [Lachnospiraceae bacterium]